MLLLLSSDFDTNPNGTLPPPPKQNQNRKTNSIHVSLSFLGGFLGKTFPKKQSSFFWGGFLGANCPPPPKKKKKLHGKRNLNPEAPELREPHAGPAPHGLPGAGSAAAGGGRPAAQPPGRGGGEKAAGENAARAGRRGRFGWTKEGGAV